METGGVVEIKETDGIVEIKLPSGEIGVDFLGTPPFVDKVHNDSPLADKVRFGMYFVSLAIPDRPTLAADTTSKIINTTLSSSVDLKGRILVLSAKKPAPDPKPAPLPTSSGRHETKHIILKKTWKWKGHNYRNEKSFSFHGASMSGHLASRIQAAWNGIPLRFGVEKLKLQQEKETGTFHAFMDHDFQKYHEEDAVAAVLDTMAAAGWMLRLQYDSEINSSKLSGASFSRREMFIFQK